MEWGIQMIRRDAGVLLVLVLMAVGFLALLALVLSSGLCAAVSYVNYTDNEDSTHARWLEPSQTQGPVAVWKRQGGVVNQDWWRFNATGGQNVEIKYRKYTPGYGTDSPDLALPGFTFYVLYEVRGPYVPGTLVYSYETGAASGGQQTTDRHKRDECAFVVPETVDSHGSYFIRVYVDPPQSGTRDWAFYWLNVTVTDRPSLDTIRTYTGVMEQKNTYDVDFNFEDCYTIDLSSSNVTGDLVRAHVRKESAAGSVYLDAWEVLAFGNTRESLMVNRTYVTTSQDIDIFFTADHTGQYQIRVYRDFWS